MAKRSFTAKAIGAAGAVLAGVSFLVSASIITERSSPEVSAMLFPLNAEAQVRMAELDFAAGSNMRAQNPAEGAEHLARAEAAARKSLAGMPLNPRALRIMALSDPVSPTTQALLVAGDAQSRRDTLTQIYMIEFAAQSGEIGKAMDHYDTVLRRRSSYRDAAGRNLALALALPEVLDEVTVQLTQSPSWESMLYFYVIKTPESYPSFLEMHRRLAGTDTIPAATSAQFAGALAQQGLFDEAVEIAGLAGQTPMARGTSLTETDFVIEPQYPGAWTVPESSSAFLQPISGGGAMLALPSGTTGLLGYRLVALNPGRYTAALAIEADETGTESAETPQTARSSRTGRAAEAIEARLSCARVSPQNLAVNPGDRTITVTGDCRYQWLALYLTETQTRAGDVFIDAITIKPAR